MSGEEYPFAGTWMWLYLAGVGNPPSLLRQEPLIGVLLQHLPRHRPRHPIAVSPARRKRGRRCASGLQQLELADLTTRHGGGVAHAGDGGECEL